MMMTRVWEVSGLTLTFVTLVRSWKKVFFYLAFPYLVDSKISKLPEQDIKKQPENLESQQLPKQVRIGPT